LVKYTRKPQAVLAPPPLKGLTSLQYFQGNILIVKYARKPLAVLSSPALRGSGRTALATVVARCESWGVRKTLQKAVFKGSKGIPK